MHGACAPPFVWAPDRSPELEEVGCYSVTGRLLCSCALACLLLVTSVQTIAPPVQLLPVDEASRQPDFFSFRAQLQTSLARHDADAVMAVLDPNIKLSFGGDDGIENFRRMWRPTEADSELWAELGAVLALGGTFSSESSFTAPYVFSKWPDRFDGFEHVALIASNVRIRSAPQADASTVATLELRDSAGGARQRHRRGRRLDRRSTRGQTNRLRRLSLRAQPDRLSCDVQQDERTLADDVLPGR